MFFFFRPQRRKTHSHFSNPARWNNSAAASRQPQPSRSAHAGRCRTVKKGANPQSSELCLLLLVQDSPVAVDGRQATSSVADRKVNLLTFLPLKQQHTVSNLVSIWPTVLLITLCCCVSSIGSKSFASWFLLPLVILQDLGLSTGRGRGHCKNQSCDYMYKNRHKPAVCPKCGCELTQKNAKGTKVKAVFPRRLRNQSAAVSPTLDFLYECQLICVCTVVSED